MENLAQQENSLSPKAGTAQTIVQQLQEKGYMLQAEAMQKILASPNPEELVKTALENAASTSSLFITLDDLVAREKTRLIVPQAPQPDATPVVRVEKTLYKPIAREYSAEIKKISGFEEIGTTGTIDDFIDCFRNRFEQLSGMLKARGGGSVTTIEGVKKRRGDKTRVIVMISDKRTTKNGHLLFNCEDLSGNINILVPGSNRELTALAQTLVLDEVVAFEGRLSKELFIADAFYQPDLPQKELKTIKEPLQPAHLLCQLYSFKLSVVVILSALQPLF